MTTFEKIKKIAKERGLSIKELSLKVGFGESTIYKWKTQQPKSENLKIVADYLGVTTDYLLEDEVNNYFKLNEKEKRDIGLEAERLLAGLESGAEVSFYGEPMTEEEKVQMRTILELGLQMNKEKAKKKFTPKKYRND